MSDTKVHLAGCHHANPQPEGRRCRCICSCPNKPAGARKFIKKPVEVEAVPCADALLAAAGDWSGLPIWLANAYEAGKVLFLPDAVELVTLEGTMRADRADWIIRGIQGEIYPCKPDIFEATYERVP